MFDQFNLFSYVATSDVEPEPPIFGNVSSLLKTLNQVSLLIPVPVPKTRFNVSRFSYK